MTDLHTCLGPVVRTPVSANLRLNFNPGFFTFLSKALSRIIFSFLFRVTNRQIVGKENKLNLLFKLSLLSSIFALTLGYLNPALNNRAVLVGTLFYCNTCSYFCEMQDKTKPYFDLCDNMIITYSLSVQLTSTNSFLTRQGLPKAIQ